MFAVPLQNFEYFKQCLRSVDAVEGVSQSIPKKKPLVKRPNSAVPLRPRRSQVVTTASLGTARSVWNSSLGAGDGAVRKRELYRHQMATIFAELCNRLWQLWDEAGVGTEARTEFATQYFGDVSVDTVTMVTDEIHRYLQVRSMFGLVQALVEEREKALHSVEDMLRVVSGSTNAAPDVGRSYHVPVSALGVGHPTETVPPQAGPEEDLAATFARCLGTLRAVTIALLLAVQQWRNASEAEQKPLLWLGSPYVIKMKDDTGFLKACLGSPTDSIRLLSHCLTEEVVSTPLLFDFEHEEANEIPEMTEEVAAVIFRGIPEPKTVAEVQAQSAVAGQPYRSRGEGVGARNSSLPDSVIAAYTTPALRQLAGQSKLAAKRRSLASAAKDRGEVYRTQALRALEAFDRELELSSRLPVRSPMAPGEATNGNSSSAEGALDPAMFPPMAAAGLRPDPLQPALVPLRAR
eukprot:RCo033402